MFNLPPTTSEQRRQEEKSEQVKSYPAALWPWSGWCGHLRWGNPEMNISKRKNKLLSVSQFKEEHQLYCMSKYEALGIYVSLCIKSLTCSDLIFIVKSPASKLSRMSL